MDKELFLRKLSRSARWRLPYGEAEEVIRDYRELLGDSGGEDFGDPVEAVRLLERPREYRRWLLVFALLAVIALTAPVSSLHGLPFIMGAMVSLPVLEDIWSFFSWNPGLLLLLPLAGMALALVWSRQDGARGEARLSRGRVLLPLMAQLAVILGAWLLFALLVAESPGVMTYLLEHPWTVQGARLFLILSGPLCGALAVWGLVRARVEDRRWLAVYLLGLTAAGLCTAVLALMQSISLDTTAARWWMPYIWKYAVLSLGGLLGAGWALC